jgi:uncharacterized protein (TIGR03086 family)
MTEPVTLINQALREFGRRVERIGLQQWSDPTPCSDWTVGELVDHVIDENLWVPPLLGGHSIETAGQIVEGAKTSSAGDRPAQWETASIGASRAWGEPGALERAVMLSRGPTPATVYLDELVMDLTVHAWDLGTAIGLHDALPDDQIARATATLQAWGDLEATGVFAAPIAVPDDAGAEARLVAMSGRRPR